MKKTEFFSCGHCRSVVQVIQGPEGASYSCCGKPMERLVAGATEGAAEKHLPVVEKNGNQVRIQVGSMLHPMTEEHSIGWVYLETRQGGQLSYLEPGMKPQAVFSVAEGDAPVAAYAWCNLHGFWKTEIQ